MTHLFSFNYHTRAYYFMWDSESGSLHNVDFVTFLIAKDRFEHDLNDEQLAQLKSLDEKEVSEVNAELDELVKEGVLDSPCTCTQTCKKIGEIKALCLHICHDCNLKCQYCFADEGTYHTRNRAHMSSDRSMQFVVIVNENFLPTLSSIDLAYSTICFTTSKFINGSPPKKSTSRFFLFPLCAIKKSIALFPTSKVI